MSWEAILATGRGTLEFRVKIAGLDYEFVTNSMMVQDKIDDTGTGPGGMVYRRNGLKREGLSIQEEAILPENRVDLTGNSFTVTEDHDYSATRAFYRRPTKFSQLMIDRASPTATSIGTTNGTRWASGDYAWIGSECIRLFAEPAPTTTGNSIWSVQRGKLGSIAQRHFTTTDLGDVVRPVIQDVPFGIENRRVTLYAYGDGDDLQGDGTAIWRGLVTQEASTIDGMNWTFEAGPVTEVLSGEIGSSFEEITFRGLYFSKREWKLEFQRLDGPKFYSTVGPGGTIGTPADEPTGTIISCTGSGFYESKWDLASDLNNQLVTASRAQWSESSTTMGCIIIDGDITFTFTSSDDELLLSGVMGSTSDGIRRENRVGPDASKPIDGYQLLRNLPERLTSQYDPSIGGNTFRFASDSRLQVSVRANQTYGIRTLIPVPDILAPYYGSNDGGSSPGALRRPKRMHVSTEALSSELNTILVYRKGDSEETAEDGASSGDTGDTLIGQSLGRDTVSVDLSRRAIEADVYRNFVATNGDTYMIAGTNFVRSGHVVDFVSSLVEKAPNLANQGFCPLIGPDDFDLVDMQAVISTINLNSYTRSRSYSFYQKGKTLAEVLAAEYKLIGVYPALTPDGKLTIRPFRQITSLERPRHNLTSNDILTDETFMPLIPNKYGIWNSVELKTRYDPQQDEHKGQTFIVNNFDSIAQNSGKRKTIVIDPVSSPNTAQLPVEQFIEPFLVRETSLLAFKYYVTSIEVPMTMFSSSIGDTIKIENRQIPNPYNNSGTRRGNALLGGIIVGRQFNLAEGFGRIEVLVSNEKIFGELVMSTQVAAYAPEIVVAGTSASSPTTVVYSLSPEQFDIITGPDVTLSDHFNIGDRINLALFDSDTESTGGVGTVTGINGFDLDVKYAGVGDVPPLGLPPGGFTVQFAPDTEATGSGAQSDSGSQYVHVDSGAQANLQQSQQSFPGGDYNFTISF